MTPPRVVFVSHNASRSGAPLLLLALQRWLIEHRSFSVATVLLDGGPLEPDFRSVGPVLAVEDLGTTDADVVHLNTVGSAPALEHLRRGPAVCCHVHELDYALTHWITDADRRRLRDRVDRFLVVSDMVAAAVVRCLGVEQDKIVRHYGFIDVGAVRAFRRADRPDGPPVIGTSGTTEWRKAPDLFLALARAVRAQCPESRFPWVGGSARGPEIDGVLADRARLGLDEVVDFVCEQDDARPWFASFDVFALMSREDPFPLTCLEAAALGVPVVAFDSTGAREFLAEGRGVVVPYPDVEAMAAEVVDLLGDDARRQAIVSAAEERVTAEHDIEVAAPRLAAELEGLVRT